MISIRSNSLLHMKSLYEIKIVTNKMNNIHIASYLFTYILRYLTQYIFIFAKSLKPVSFIYLPVNSFNAFSSM